MQLGQRSFLHSCATQGWHALLPSSSPRRCLHSRGVRCAAAAEQPGLYSQPQLYSRVFGYRNFDAEARFLLEAYKRHSASPDNQKASSVSVLDLGCGPAEHARKLAASVQRVVGLDCSPAMLEYARAQAQEEGASKLSFRQGDMCNFDSKTLLDGEEGAFDMVLNLLGTFSHVKSNHQALQMFGCVSKALRPGGLFILELAHPGDLFDGSLMDDETKKEMWDVEDAGNGNRLLVEWGDESDLFDPVTQIIDRLVTITEFKGKKGDEVVQTQEERVLARQYTVGEIDLLARVSGLEVSSLRGDMESNIGLTHEEAYRLVAILRKR